DVCSSAPLKATRDRRHHRSLPCLDVVTVLVRARLTGRSSEVEALVLEVEVAAHAQPHVVADGAAATQIYEGLALGVEQLAAESLIVLRSALDRAVVPVVEAGAEAIGPEAIRTTHALGRVLANPLLVDELLESRESRLRSVDACLRVRAILDPVVLEPQHADDGGEGEAHAVERREDHREGEEENECSAGKGSSRVGLER